MSDTKKALRWFYWPVWIFMLVLFFTAVMLFFADDTWRQASAAIGPMIGMISGVYVLANNAINKLEAKISLLEAKITDSNNE